MLRYAIGALIAAGLLALGFVLVQSLGPSPDDPRRLARGAVVAFEIFENPEPAPEASFVNGKGEELKLTELRGKVLLVNLWATWCGPCKTEMPTLDALQAEMGGEDFQVVAISLDRKGPDLVRSYYERHNLDNLALYNDRRGSIMGELALRGLPVSMIVDRNSKVVGRLVGPAEWNTPEAKALVRHFIKG